MSTDAPQELKDSFKAWLAANTPPGTRLVVQHDGYTEPLQVLCNGTVEYMVYRCGNAPGHEGDCYCTCKFVDYTPEKGGPTDYLTRQR